MVQIVNNTINGYRMGSIRALAQEPVQNAKDAVRGGPVSVEYRLYPRPIPDIAYGYMLTITDSGTSGLAGRIPAPAELKIASGQIKQGDDWAAFEGHGYTKVDQDALGSRGQGKSAFLYHSQPDRSKELNDMQRRMVILYDTLLADGEYRLGVRYANPSDTVRQPPFLGDEAKQLVSSDAFEIDSDLIYSLRLEPLCEVGTRIVIPYLSDEAFVAFQSGELKKWLELCWWRAIQDGDLSISVVGLGGERTSVGVPEWAASEFWEPSSLNGSSISGSSPDGRNVQTFIKNAIPIKPQSGFEINRVVLYHNPAFKEYEHLADSSEPEYDGVQIFRGKQWIETLGAKQEFADLIPPEQRRGFRGFVEFSTALDRELRKKQYESPQHDKYSRRTKLVQDIVGAIKQCLEEFSRNNGWTSDHSTRTDATRREREIAENALKVLTKQAAGKDIPFGRSADNTSWSLNFSVGYPNKGTTRVNWGQRLNNLGVSCQSTPPVVERKLSFWLFLHSPSGNRQQIAVTSSSLDEEGKATASFGDFVIVQNQAEYESFVASNEPQAKAAKAIICSTSGKYSLAVSARYKASQIKRASRSIYVEEEPPQSRPRKPITLNVKTVIQNNPNKKRINNREQLAITVDVTNRTSFSSTLLLDAVLVASAVPSSRGHQDAPMSLLLAKKLPVEVGGIERLGESESTETVFSETVRLLSGFPSSPPTDLFFSLLPGIHHLNVDLYRDIPPNGTQPRVMPPARAKQPPKQPELIASKSVRIYFQVNPPGQGSSIPFEISRQETSKDADFVFPLWELEKPDHEDDPYNLLYSPSHHFYEMSQLVKKQSSGGDEVSVAMILEMIADAYLDWMYEPFQDSGDDSRYAHFLERPDRQDDSRWQFIAEQITALRDRQNEDKPDTIELARLRRTVVANMVSLLAGEEL